MAHPRMFDTDDPYLARVREIALALPETVEQVKHGRPWFYAGRLYAIYGGGPKGAAGEIESWAQTLLFRPDDSERVALEQDPRIFVPAYVGPSGWLGIRLDEETDWVEIRELLTDSWRQNAPKRAQKEL